MTTLTHKWIPQFENLYQASSNGSIVSFRYRKPRPLKQYLKRGYYYVDLYKDNTRHTFRVNRLILLTFVGNPPHSGHVSCHINGDPLDNRLDNLRWASQSDNEMDKQRSQWQKKEQ